MGNATGGSGGGWLFSSDDTTLVLLRLNGARNIALGLGEELQGSVRLGSEAPISALLTKHEPARLNVGADTVIVVEFRIASAACISASSAADRFLGEVRLPLQHVAHRCGRGLYHMWFPIGTSLLNGQTLGGSGGAAMAGLDTLESFDRSLRNPARDPRVAMVCLSLCHAADASTEPMEAVFEVNLPPSSKALHFGSVLHSHAQHARLLQALYRICRTDRNSHTSTGSDRGAPVPLGQTANDALLDSLRPRGIDNTTDNVANAQLSEEIGHLQNEIAQTTSEANDRINQASEAIRTLKERLATRHSEAERTRQDNQRMRRDADLLDLENERLELTLHRGGGANGLEDAKEETKRLKKDVLVLTEQKEALMLILEDLCGAVGRPSAPVTGGATAPAAVQAKVAPLPALAPPATPSIASAAPANGTLSPPQTDGRATEEEHQSWVNLLPRPSELFESGAF